MKDYQQQLHQIQATMVNGKFLADDSSVPENQDIVVGLLERCLRWSDIVLTRYLLFLHFVASQNPR